MAVLKAWPALMNLRDWLGHGPELARVLKLQIKALPLQQFVSFEVR